MWENWSKTVPEGENFQIIQSIRLKAVLLISLGITKVTKSEQVLKGTLTTLLVADDMYVAVL